METLTKVIELINEYNILANVTYIISIFVFVKTLVSKFRKKND